MNRSPLALWFLGLVILAGFEESGLQTFGKVTRHYVVRVRLYCS